MLANIRRAVDQPPLRYRYHDHPHQHGRNNPGGTPAVCLDDNIEEHGYETHKNAHGRCHDPKGETAFTVEPVRDRQGAGQRERSLTEEAYGEEPDHQRYQSVDPSHADECDSKGDGDQSHSSTNTNAVDTVANQWQDHSCREGADEVRS